jgi:hypothetical protein
MLKNACSKIDDLVGFIRKTAKNFDSKFNESLSIKLDNEKM